MDLETLSGKARLAFNEEMAKVLCVCVCVCVTVCGVCLAGRG